MRARVASDSLRSDGMVWLCYSFDLVLAKGKLIPNPIPSEIQSTEKLLSTVEE